MRIVVFLDVSGSMEPYSRFLLQFVKGLVCTWIEADAYLFHTKLVRVTDAVRETDTVKAMTRLALLADGFDLSALAISDRDAVVVASDREALKAALASPAAYVGMVGSRAKVAALLEQLGAEIPPARKSVLHGPAGLDIGAIDPEEIALSILAEIVQERRRSVRVEAQDSVTG